MAPNRSLQTSRPAPILTLSLDTSTNQGGIAIVRGETVLSRRIWTREKSHSEMLTATLQDCLAEAQVQVVDLTRIAVGKGPGSFTGIRIAINVARTLGYTLGLPVYAFDTNEILAAGVSLSVEESASTSQIESMTPPQLPLVTLVNAHKNLLYTSRFEIRDGVWRRSHGPNALSLVELESLVTGPHLCVGDGFLEFESVLSPALRTSLVREPTLCDFPQPEVLGRMPDLTPVAPLVWNEVQALYIRSSEAEEKLRERLQARPGKN